MMSQAKREQLSTLIDDELDPAEMEVAFGVLTGDRELRAVWDRYHLIGDALCGEPLSRDVLNVAQRVRDRLDADLVVPPPHPRRRMSRHWLGALVGSALAASVAMVALIVGPEIFNDGDAVPLRLAEETPANPTLYVDRTGTYWSLKRPEVETKLNSFLVNHQEYAPATGIKGYATFVSYDARR
jgi:sigma-E factor negative regulatory protein RseA